MVRRTLSVISLAVLFVLWSSVDLSDIARLPAVLPFTLY